MTTTEGYTWSELDRMADESGAADYAGLRALIASLRPGPEDDSTARGQVAAQRETLEQLGELLSLAADFEDGEYTGDTYDDEAAAASRVGDLALATLGYRSTLEDFGEGAERMLNEHGLELVYTGSRSMASANDGDAWTVEGFRWLLCWGGPAVRVVGTLDNWGQVDAAHVEGVDWFGEWTRYGEDLDGYALAAVARFVPAPDDVGATS